MRAPFKYAIVLGSGVAVGLWLSGPRSVDLAVGPAPSEATAIVNDTAAPSAADEDLDYLIARRIGTLEAWQSFLAAHAAGDHADSATAEIDKLMLLAKASSPAATEAVTPPSPDQTSVAEAPAAAPPLEDPAPPVPRACERRDGCSADSRDPPSGDILERVASAEPGDFGDRTASLPISSSEAAAAVPIPPERDQSAGPRATAPSHGPVVSAQAAPKRPEPRCVLGFGCHFSVHALPPILQALLGVRTRHPARTYRQVADGSVRAR